MGNEVRVRVRVRVSSNIKHRYKYNAPHMFATQQNPWKYKRSVRLCNCRLRAFPPFPSCDRTCTERRSVGRAEIERDENPREMMKLRLDVPREFGTPVPTPERKITSSWPWAWKRDWTDTPEEHRQCSQNSLTKKKKNIREQTGNLEPKNSWKFWLGHVQYKCTGR